MIFRTSCGRARNGRDRGSSGWIQLNPSQAERLILRIAKMRLAGPGFVVFDESIRIFETKYGSIALYILICARATQKTNPT